MQDFRPSSASSPARSHNRPALNESALEPAPAIGVHLDAHEIPLALAPAEAGDRVDRPPITDVTR